MKKISKILGCAFLLVWCCACQSQIRPGIVPQQETKMTKSNTHSLGIIGDVEPIYFPPIKSSFSARIDTGAENSSIDVTNMRFFERDSEKWVAFNLKNRQSGEVHLFEKKIEKKTMIKRIDSNEQRVVVMMDVKIGNQMINAKFSLADREKFEYQGLIGRNILTGRALVDTSLSNTLH